MAKPDSLRGQTEQQMMQMLEDRAKLLSTGNRAASILLATENEKHIEASLLETMELTGQALGADRVQIWRNRTDNGVLYFTHAYQWLSELGKNSVPVPIGLRFPYSDRPDWEGRFKRREHINSPLSLLPEDDKVFLQPYSMKSIAIIPLFLQDNFWGFFSIDDMKQERFFTDDEVSMMRTVSLMMASAVNRAAQVIKIRKAHERAMSLLGTMPFACHLWNDDYVLIDCNEENLRMFNLTSKQEFLGKWTNFVPYYQPNGQRSAEMTVNAIKETFEKGKAALGECMYQQLDGTPMPAEVTLVRMPFEDGYAVAAYLRDLREQKQMMNEIEQRDYLLSTVNLIAGILLRSEKGGFKNDLNNCLGMMGKAVDADRVYVWENHTYSGKLCCTQKYEWSGNAQPQQDNDITVNISYSENMPGWEETLSAGKCINNIVRLMSAREQAQLIPQGIMSVLIVPVFMKDVFWGFVGFDDCRRERIFSQHEENILRSGSLLIANAVLRNTQSVEIRESNERTRLLLNAMPLACRLWNKNRQIFDFNEESLRLFNITDGHVFIDRYFDFLPEFQPDGSRSKEKADEYLDTAFREGIWAGEWMQQTLEGELIPSEVTLIRLPYENDYVVAGYTRDLREHNKMMAEIRDTSEKLELALKDAEKANSAKSDFLASMSHEMRTPLNAVIGLSELCLESDNARGMDDEIRMNLEKINRAGSTLLDTVNEILDISKIEAGRLELIPDEYDVSGVISDTVTQNILRINAKPIEFKLDVSDDMFARLYGDELRVRQVINNLLSNAVKYTREGVVEMSMHCIHESGKPGDAVWLDITVRDTGVGIKAEDIELLFSDYSQADIKINRKIEGTGLGLPITKRLAKLMDGFVSIESEYGKGSVFKVRLKQKFVTDVKISPEAVISLKNFRYFDNRREQNKQLQRVKLPGARVLVVDDNLANLDVARGLMKPYGMRVDCVTDGQQAIDVIRDNPGMYNAIFMDHMMPGMNGIEAALHIKNIGTEYAENIPIIALTANAVAGNEQIFLNKGFSAFLTKPIDLIKLDEVIRKTIDSERFSVDGLDIVKGIEFFTGDRDTYFDVLSSFITNTKNLLPKIESVDKAGLAVYATLVHGIKGSSRSVCAYAIGDMAEKLENAADAGDLEYVRENNAHFIEAVGRLIGDAGKMLEGIHAATQKPQADEPDAAALVKLCKACKAYDTETALAVMKELENRRYKSGDELIKRLRESVNQMNYKQVIKILSQEGIKI